MAERLKLGELLVNAGIIDAVQLQSALAYQKKWGMRLGSALIEMKFITERNLASFLEQQLNTRCVSIMAKELHPDAINAIDPDAAKKYGIFPIGVSDKEVVIAMANPFDLPTIDELGFRCGKRVRAELALESEIKKAINFYYDNIREAQPAPYVPDEPVLDRIQMTPGDRGAETESSEKKEVTTKAVIDALITLLDQKGIVKRSELIDLLKKKQQ